MFNLTERRAKFAHFPKRRKPFIVFGAILYD